MSLPKSSWGNRLPKDPLGLFRLEGALPGAAGMLERGEAAETGVRLQRGGVAAEGSSRGTVRSGEDGESQASTLAAMLAWKC